jgi:hypothetical protein
LCNSKSDNDFGAGLRKLLNDNCEDARGGIMQLMEDKISCVTQRDRAYLFHVTEEEGRAFIVASVKSPADSRKAASQSYTQIAEVLSQSGMVGVHERIFGSLSVEHDVMSARSQAFTSFGILPENSVTYIEGNPPWGEGLAGVIIHAVKADEVWTVIDSGAVRARVEKEWADTLCSKIFRAIITPSP